MHRAAQESEFRRQMKLHNAARETELNRRRRAWDEVKKGEVEVTVNEDELGSVNVVDVQVRKDSDEANGDETDDVSTPNYNKNSHVSLQKTCKYSVFMCTF